MVANGYEICPEADLRGANLHGADTLAAWLEYYGAGFVDDFGA